MASSWSLRCQLSRPWLDVTLPEALRCLSWAPVGGGTTTADRVVWREVRDADLGPEFDAVAWLASELEARGQAGAIGLLTSRNVARYTTVEASADGVRAAVCATVGLSNAERVGTRRGTAAPAGTINVLCAVDAALTEAAQVEALSIAVEARTAAVLDVGPRLETGTATGTGTDCLVLACRPGTTPYAGTHTAVGEAVGRAVYDAVRDGAELWRATHG